MKHIHTFESFLNEGKINESKTFAEIKDEYLDNPYGIGAQRIEYVEAGHRSSASLIFRHDEKHGRDKIESTLKSMGVPAKKLSKSTQDKGYKYRYELTMYESELVDTNEAEDNKITVKLTTKSARSFMQDLNNNGIKHTMIRPTVFQLDDTPKARMAIKLAKERFGAQNVLVESINEWRSPKVEDLVHDMTVKIKRGRYAGATGKIHDFQLTDDGELDGDQVDILVDKPGTPFEYLGLDDILIEKQF